MALRNLLGEGGGGGEGSWADREGPDKKACSGEGRRGARGQMSLGERRGVWQGRLGKERLGKRVGKERASNRVLELWWGALRV